MKPRRLHLVGIGGSGMSSLAAYLLERGDIVSGSDAKDSPILRLLVARGARVSFGANESLVRDVDQVVHTAAVDDRHPEIRAAILASVPVCKYAGFLGREMKESRGHGVAGTHGKTTTSGLLTFILERAGLDPCAVLGGFSRALPLPGRFGRGRDFVVEACEYDHSFLQLPLQTAIVTNVEADHLDYFGDLPAVIRAFQSLILQLPSDGLAVMHESAALQLDLGAITARPIVVGESDGVTDRLCIVAPQNGLERGTLCIEGRVELCLHPAIAGIHSLWNSAFAASLAVRLGADRAVVESSVREFPGMRRRLEPLCVKDGRLWFSDYGHHPTEIRAVRKALQTRFPDRRIVLVFQPHQVCRTASFRGPFAEELVQFDRVIVPGIFTAREGAQAADEEMQRLAEETRRRGKELTRVAGLAQVMDAVAACSREGDVVVLMGAGDIDDLAEPMRARYREASVA